MAFTYVVSTDRGRCRLLIMDVTAATYVFEDDEIDTFLVMEGSSVKRAAALALETIASNEAFTLKVIRLLDLSTDGPAVAASLLARAKELRSQAALEDQGTDGGAFEVVEWDLGPASVRDYWQRRRYYLGY